LASTSERAHPNEETSNRNTAERNLLHLPSGQSVSSSHFFTRSCPPQVSRAGYHPQDSRWAAAPARQFNVTLAEGQGVPFAALAQRKGVSRSYFTRLVRLSYLAPDLTQAILDGRQPRDLTAEKLLEHSRLPLAWHEQRATLGFT
jgi:hypothetical protein